MYGATIGTLAVITGSGSTVWTRSGQQQTSRSDSWVITGATINDATFKFRGTRGTSYTGDIAVDYVGIRCASSG